MAMKAPNARPISRVGRPFQAAAGLLPGSFFLGFANAQGPENVLVVVNENSALSKSIGEYYVQRRSIPLAHLCRIKASPEEDITHAAYSATIAKPIEQCLESQGLIEKILYIVTTAGVPLRVKGAAPDTIQQ